MSQTNTSLPVLITGAGPAGLVLALTLLKSGVAVRIIDKSPTFHNTQRGAGLQPRSLELLNLLGVLPDILPRSGRVLPFKLYKLPGGTEVLRTWEAAPRTPPSPSVPWPVGVIHGQQHTEAILRKHLEQYGVQVELATELRSFEQFTDHVIAHIVKKNDEGEIEEAVHAHWLVGADGARGVVRKQLGLSFLGDTATTAEHFILGDLHLSGLDRDYWHMWGNASSTLLVIRPTEQPDDTFWIAAGGNIDHEKLLSDHGEFVKFVHSATNRNDIKIGEIISVRDYKPNVRMVNKFGEGRVFVVGDAAHVHSATGGQGLNSSIQDAVNLAWKLALVEKQLSPSSILDTYNSERLPVIAEMLQRTTELLKKTLTQSADGSDVSAWKRDRSLTQLGINYRWSEIVIDERNKADDSKDKTIDPYGKDGDPLHAGDRAPEAPKLKDVTASDDTTTSLFHIFSVTQHTALIFTDDSSQVNPVLDALDRYPSGTVSSVVVLPQTVTEVPVVERAKTVLQDTEGHAYEIYGVPEKHSTVFMIRPDGVVGAILSGADGVERYRQLLFPQA